MANHHEYLPIASITGIDGSGKSSAARSAQLALSEANPGFTGLEADRELYKISGGRAERLLAGDYDEKAAKIDGGNSLIRSLHRAAYAGAKAELGRSRARELVEDVDLLVNVRDPVLDSFIFAKSKLPLPSPQFSLNAIGRAIRSRRPDTLLWLDAPPELALERIEANRAERAVYGEQSHENLDDLRKMQNSYELATRALGAFSDTRVVRIDASQPADLVSANVQDVLNDTIGRAGQAKGVLYQARSTTAKVSTI